MHTLMKCNIFIKSSQNEKGCPRSANVSKFVFFSSQDAKSVLHKNKYVSSLHFHLNVWMMHHFIFFHACFFCCCFLLFISFHPTQRSRESSTAPASLSHVGPRSAPITLGPATPGRQQLAGPAGLRGIPFPSGGRMGTAPKQPIRRRETATPHSSQICPLPANPPLHTDCGKARWMGPALG